MAQVRGSQTVSRFAWLLTVLLGTLAFAQSQNGAVGLKIGEGRLHPFLDVGATYDSAVGYFNRNSAGEAILSPELIFDFRGGTRFDLQTNSTTIGFNGALEYLFYSGLLSPSSRALSRFQANVGLETAFNKDGAVEFDLGDNFLRSDRTQNPVIGVGVLSLFNEVHVQAPIHPGGRALEITPRVGWAVEFFDPLLTGAVAGCAVNDITCNPNTLGKMNYSNLNFALTGRYKFLPKTAVVLDSSFDYRTYFDPTSTNRAANVFHVQAGLNGLISARISLTVMAGVVHDFGPSNATAPIGQLQVSYIPTDLTTISIGYVRNVLPTPVYGVFADDRGYLTVKIGFLDGRLTLNGDVGVDYFSFYGVPTTGPAVGRNDFLVGGRVGPSFAITNWFDVSAGYGLSFRTSSVRVSTVNYIRHEALLRLTLHY